MLIVDALNELKQQQQDLVARLTARLTRLASDTAAANTEKTNANALIAQINTVLDECLGQ